MLTSTTQEKTDGWESGLDAAMGTAWRDAAACLVDALLHEARNPLNALAIHLEVLTEKVRSAPVSPPNTEKNLRTMRDQIYRVDQILRRFAEFLAPKVSGETDVKLSELLHNALDVLGHQIRKKHLRMSVRIEPDVFVSFREPSGARFLVLQPLLRSINRLPPDSELRVSLSRDGSSALLCVDAQGWRLKDEDRSLASAVERLCQINGGNFSLQEGEARLALPLMGTA